MREAGDYGAIVRENMDAVREREEERERDYADDQPVCSKCGVWLKGEGICKECSGEGPEYE